MVVNSVQKSASLKLAKLCFKLERELVGAWVWVNAYLTPPSHQGFMPHIDTTDSFILQVDGIKHWRVCDRFDFEYNPAVQTKEINFASHEAMESKHCQNVTLSPGDILYVPHATWHDAKSTDEYSLHLTVTIDRQAFSWWRLLVPLLSGGRDKSEVEGPVGAAAAKSPKLASMLPRHLDGILTSLDDDDVPSGLLESLAEEARGLLPSSGDTGLPLGDKLGAKLQKAIKAPTMKAWSPVFLEMRQRGAVGASKRSGRLCFGTVGWPVGQTKFETVAEALSNKMFRRIPDVRAMIVKPQQGWLLFVDGERVPVDSPVNLAGVRYAMALHDKSASRGAAFTMVQLAHAMGSGDRQSQASAVMLLATLLQACAVEEVSAAAEVEHAEL